MTVRNERDVPIVLGGPISCQPIHVAIVSLAREDDVWGGAHCLLACDVSLDGVGGCTADCPFPEPVVIAAGETATIEWPGLLARWVSLPEQCCESDYCADECPIVIAAEPGDYRATLAFVEITEEEAAACSSDPFTCPGAFEGQEAFETVDQDFELGAGDILLGVTPNSP
jgi:hypothetical protein